MTPKTRPRTPVFAAGLLAAGAAALLFSSTAHAQPYVTTTDNAAMASFYQADANGDGYLSPYEMQFLPYSVQVALSGADFNADGYISIAEAQAVLIASYRVAPVRLRHARRYRLRVAPRYRPHYRRGLRNRRRGVRTPRWGVRNGRRGVYNGRRGRVTRPRTTPRSPRSHGNRGRHRRR